MNQSVNAFLKLNKSAERCELGHRACHEATNFVTLLNA